MCVPSIKAVIFPFRSVRFLSVKERGRSILDRELTLLCVPRPSVPPKGGKLDVILRLPFRNLPRLGWNVNVCWTPQMTIFPYVVGLLLLHYPTAANPPSHGWGL